MLAAVGVALLGDVERVVESGEHGVPGSCPEILPDREGHERDSWRAWWFVRRKNAEIIRSENRGRARQLSASGRARCGTGPIFVRGMGAMQGPVVADASRTRASGQRPVYRDKF